MVLSMIRFPDLDLQSDFFSPYLQIHPISQRLLCFSSNSVMFPTKTTDQTTKTGVFSLCFLLLVHQGLHLLYYFSNLFLAFSNPIAHSLS